MSTPKYSRQSIDDFADKIRNGLGLKPPITAYDMRHA